MSPRRSRYGVSVRWWRRYREWPQLQRQSTDNTNFAILVSTNFTEPFHDPNGYGVHIARLANMLGGSVLVQRLGDLKLGRRSTRSRIERGLVKPTLAEAEPGIYPLPFHTDI